MLQRRQFIQGAGAAGLAPLAVVLADRELAAQVAAGLETVTIESPSGPISAALAKPRPEETPAPAVLLIHEWWGLNDQIKSMAAELAGHGYLALAVDLYGGAVATTPEQARTLVDTVEPEVATETLVAWARWLRNRPDAAGRLGVVGWCFGGGWALNLALAEPLEATVIYYGRVDQPAAALGALQGPVLGHFATEDQFINPQMVEGFEQALAESDKEATIHWYEADHAFANPSGGAYDEPDAAMAWQRTLEFFDRYLKG